MEGDRWDLYCWEASFLHSRICKEEDRLEFYVRHINKRLHTRCGVVNFRERWIPLLNRVMFIYYVLAAGHAVLKMPKNIKIQDYYHSFHWQDWKFPLRVWYWVLFFFHSNAWRSCSDVILNTNTQEWRRIRFGDPAQRNVVYGRECGFAGCFFLKYGSNE